MKAQGSRLEAQGRAFVITAVVAGIALTVPVSTQKAAAPPLVITAYNGGASLGPWAFG
jgi:hypothetical protein